MVTFVLDDDDRALAVMRALRVAAEATSLGGVETLVSMPFNSSHASLGADERLRAGIAPGMLRLSVGLEPLDALCDDLAAGAGRAPARRHRRGSRPMSIDRDDRDPRAAATSPAG